MARRRPKGPGCVTVLCFAVIVIVCGVAGLNALEEALKDWLVSGSPPAIGFWVFVAAGLAIKFVISIIGMISCLLALLVR